MNIGFMINYYSKILKNKLTREFENEDITVSQFVVIKDIEMNSFKNNRESTVTSVEIAERLDMDKPTLSGIINRLTDKEYVKKLPNPTDKRSYTLELTKKAKDKLPTLEKKNNKVLSDATEELTTDEIILFKTILNKLIKHMR